jgi:lipoprotein signal peptidase
MRKYYLGCLSLIILDRFLKIFFVKTLPESGSVFALYINKNIAFSLPLPSIILYPILAIIFFLLVWLWFDDWRVGKKYIWPYALIIIGAASNIWDRLWYGGVVDYLNVPYFTVLNLSDVYIFLGVCYFLVRQLKKQKYD